MEDLKYLQLWYYLAEVFGENSVASLSGDDYHLYERNSKKWGKLTHLNPNANNLKQFENDSISLKSRNAVICREYNHEKGEFTYPSIFLEYKTGIASVGIDYIPGEIVTEESLQTQLEKKIFKPMGMQDTGFSVTPENLYR